jgi:two-component system sensor histidine kinase/response regulator
VSHGLTATEPAVIAGWPSGPPPDDPPPPLSLSDPGALELVVEMAHDLRSPVASILVLAEALQLGEAGPVNELQHRQLGLIRSAAYCLCAVASDVLSLAKGSASLIEAEPVPFSVRDVFVAVRDMVAPLLEYKKLDLRYLGTADDRRLGHPRALMRVLLNLTTNALKVTDRGSVEISADDVDSSASAIRFAIRDTGPGLGVPLSQALEPFRQDAASRRTAFSSFGLGLTICDRLVRRMGGVLEMDTRPGGGSCVSFTLDLPPAPDD